MPHGTPSIGLGCMRLSTAPDRDDERSIAVIHAALDAGATLLDTADSYCHDERETGHNERLIATALERWHGERSTIEVATKGGLRRSGGMWIPDGRARRLRQACESSRRALETDAIDLYQLHVVDPRTPIETSVRALGTLQREGAIRRIGLCNVNVRQIAAAREITEIASVQVSLSVLDSENLRNGVAEYCRDHGIRIIAYRPLGGERRERVARSELLGGIAAEHDATPEEIALAWLMDLSPDVVPVPGATRIETARSSGRSRAVRLTDANRAALDARFHGRLLRVPRSARRPPNYARGDVVLVTGMPGAGKSTVAKELAARGYERLNRDARGGTLAGLVDELEAGLSAGRRQWVLDNTYPSRASRNDVIECAWRHGVQARCIHMTTALADAQINAITRLIEIHGRLPTPEELRDLSGDPRYFGPDAQFRYERMVETPTPDEGFVTVEERDFVRRGVPDEGPRAILLEYDEVLCTNAGGNGVALRAGDVVVADERRDRLRRHVEDGFLLFAQAWRPQIARGEVSAESVLECFRRTRDLLGVDIALAFCPHDAGAPICWCRKPLPGSVLEFAIPRRIDLARSIHVGRSAADRTLAQRLGMRYVDHVAFFGSASENQ